MSKMFEEVLLSLTMALWSSLCAYWVFAFLFSEGSLKEKIRKKGYFYLYFVMVFSFGSNLVLLGDDFWRTLFASIAAHATEVRVLSGLGTWIVGVGLLTYLTRLKEKDLG